MSRSAPGLLERSAEALPSEDGGTRTRSRRARWETRPPGRTESWFAALTALQGTEHVDASGRPKPLPFTALADQYRDTFRLGIGPPALGSLVVSELAWVARAPGRAPGADRPMSASRREAQT